MRRNKYDPLVLIIIIGIFLYCFFCIGPKDIFYTEGEFADGVFHHADERKGIEWSTGVFIAPLFAIVLMLLWIFYEELKPYTMKSMVVFIKDKFKKR